MRHRCQDTPTRAVYAEGGAVPINTDVKSEGTEIADTKTHRHVIMALLVLRAGSSCHRGGRLNFLFLGLISLRTQRQQAVEAMSFQGNRGEVDSQVGHEIPEADDGAQVVQLTQIQVAQIVSNAVSQALTHQIQQFQTPIKFDVPAFEGDSTASSLTWSQRVLYQARASGFEDELVAAEGDVCMCICTYAYLLEGRRQKTVYRHGSVPQRGTHEYTLTFEPLSRR